MLSLKSNRYPHRVGVTERVVFYYRWCKQCGICTAFCPKGALALTAEGRPYLAHHELCNSCGLCEVLCPDFALSVPGKHRKPEPTL